MNSRFYLKWNDFDKQLSSGFSDLFRTRDFVDVTLCCEGKTTQAHKVILGINSVFFRQIFKSNPCKHPIVIINGMKFKELTNVLEFIYNGQVNVVKSEIPHFIAAAELLKIDGISAQNPNVNSNSGGGDDDTGNNKVKGSIETTITSPHHHHHHDGQRTKNVSTRVVEPSSSAALGTRISDEDDLVIIEDNSSLSPKNLGSVKNPLHRSTEISPFNDAPNVSRDFEALSPVPSASVIYPPENSYSPVIPDTRPSTSVLMNQLQRPPSYGKNSTWTSTSTDSVMEDATTNTTTTTTTRQQSKTNPDALSSSNLKDNHHHDHQQQSCTIMPYGACGNANCSCRRRRRQNSEGSATGPSPEDEVHPRSLDVPIRSDHNNNPSGEYELSINNVEGGVYSHLKTFTTPSGMIVTSTLRPIMRPPQDTQQHHTQHSSSWSVGRKQTNTSSDINKGSSSSSSISAVAALVYSSGSQILSRLPSHVPAKKRFSHQSDTETISSSALLVPPPPSLSSSSASSSPLPLEVAGLAEQQQQPGGGGGKCVMVNGSENAIISSPISLSPSASVDVESRFKNQKRSQVPLSVRYTTAEVDAIVDSVNKHTGPFVPCRICDKQVKRERLRAHIHECHLIQGHRIICPHCGVGLKSKGSYRVHVWRHRKASAFAARKTKNLAQKAAAASSSASSSSTTSRAPPTPHPHPPPAPNNS